MYVICVDFNFFQRHRASAMLSIIADAAPRS